MATYREIALEQALAAVLGEAVTGGLDVRALIDNATTGLLGSAPYRSVEQPHVSNAIQILSAAYAEALTIASA